MREYAHFKEQFKEQFWRPERSSNGHVAATAAGWMLIGIGIGVGAALLLAPLTGRELRDAIVHGCRRTLNGISGGISRGTQELRQRGSNLLNFNRHHAG
ncbi:MAG TPA: YtxH domain-containing protein [Candidatus Angelobacter sp.]